MYKLLIAFAATLMSATGALAHGDHDDQAERSVEQVARDNVVKLVTKGQLAPSWSKAKVLSVTSRMNLAITSLMKLPRTSALRTWFMFDEVGALHRVPAIEKGLQTARNFGGAMILGLHSFEKLVEVYGEQGARNLASLARSKLILATADLDTAEQCARYIGNREVRQMDEAYSYGYNNTRDASTLTPRKQVEPLVIADDITNLPSLHGFVKFPDGFPAARIKLEWQHYPQVAEGFLPRPDPRPVRSKRAEEAFEDAEEGEAGGRDGAGQIVEEVVEPGNLAKEMAARILEQNAEEPGRNRSDDEGEKSREPQGINAQPRATGEGDPSRRGERTDAADSRAATASMSSVEDQTLVELRHDFSAGLEPDGGMDMGI